MQCAISHAAALKVVLPFAQRAEHADRIGQRAACVPAGRGYYAGLLAAHERIRAQFSLERRWQRRLVLGPQGGRGLFPRREFGIVRLNRARELDVGQRVLVAAVNAGTPGQSRELGKRRMPGRWDFYFDVRSASGTERATRSIVLE